jgi:phosphatidylglycerol:prolipoprotein diacylglycerol transferase
MAVFALLLGLGGVAGLAWVAGLAPTRETLLRLDAGLAALAGCLMGGRLAFVMVQWPYYRDHLTQTLRLDGLAWPGALLGGMLALAWYAHWVKRPFAVLAEALLPLAATVSLGAWLGCWQAGCAYGPPVNAWWGMPARDELGVITNRWPVQLIGAALTLILLALLERLRPRIPAPEMAAALGLLGGALLMLGASFVRLDPAPVWLGLRLDTWAAVGFGGWGMMWLMAGLLRMRDTGQGDRS